MPAHSKVKEQRLVLLLKGMSVKEIAVCVGEEGREDSQVKHLIEGEFWNPWFRAEKTKQSRKKSRKRRTRRLFWVKCRLEAKAMILSPLSLPPWHTSWVAKLDVKLVKKHLNRQLFSPSWKSLCYSRLIRRWMRLAFSLLFVAQMNGEKAKRQSRLY